LWDLCEDQLSDSSRIVFVSLTPFFEFADPQLDSGSDFPRGMMAGLFQSIEFRFFSIFSFDDSDFMIHNVT
jgi:hypothetical protein